MTYVAGIPHGTEGLALALAQRAADAAGRLTGRPYEVSRSDVLGHVLLPVVVGDAPVATAPRPVSGGGWIHADLLPDDEALYSIVASESLGAEELAMRCQECRLPVTPYRSTPAPWSPPSGETAPTRRVAPDAVTVIDLTAMWAGPLTTMLLAAWGATVMTVEPPVRRDGLRASPAQFAVLDAGKQRRPWDLRDADDRRHFEDAVGAADVLVESFSGRVMTNLGYSRAELDAINPGLVVVSLRAFPSDTPDASWVAYGRGVHAASGLGVVGGEPQPALLAYPDPLAGLLAFGAVLDALGAADAPTVEVSLAGAMAPLLANAGQPLDAVDAAAVADVRAATSGRPGAVIVPT